MNRQKGAQPANRYPIGALICLLSLAPALASAQVDEGAPSGYGTDVDGGTPSIAAGDVDQRESPLDRSDEEGLTAHQIRQHLQTSVGLGPDDLSSIDIEIEGATVRLRGEVSDHRTKQRIITALYEMPEVAEVRSDLR